MRGIQVPEIGGPEVMEYRDLPEPELTDGSVMVAVAAAGLNYIDTYQRNGLYPMQMPITLGMEGSGTVEAVSEGVDSVLVGDRVAWCSVAGSYADRTVAPASALVKVPDGVSFEAAAAVMLQGLTAHYLATDTFKLAPGNKCLVHAGAGGVGLLLIQLAKLLGAEVYTTVSTPAKADLATGAGADHVIRYDQTDFAEAVVAIGGERPLDVIYDGVGADTFDGGLGLLRQRGMMALFGQASGPVPPVDLQVLARNGSLFVTRPSLFHYIGERHELESRAADLFGWIAAGELDVRIGQTWPLSEAADAHRALEARQTTGKTLLLP